MIQIAAHFHFTDAPTPLQHRKNRFVDGLDWMPFIARLRKNQMILNKISYVLGKTQVMIEVLFDQVLTLFFC